jgi:hypothetical protein
MNRWLKPSLTLAAIANLAAAALFAVPDSTAGSLVGLPADVPVLYALLAGWLVAVFGIGYGALARQHIPDRLLLTLGAIGKAGFFLIVLLLWLGSSLSPRLVALAAVDLVFALFWSVWLYANRRRSA